MSIGKKPRSPADAFFLHRWTKLRRAQAAGLLTNHYRMQINRCKYVRAKNGTVKMQSTFRGRTTRRMLAAVKIQTFVRMYKLRKHFRMLKSAVIALQCATRVKIAKKVLKGFQGEQKDIGKLKENNEILKKEMQSLKAMLAAQAKEGASTAAHSKELDEKQQEIKRLEKRVAELEKQLAAEKQTIEKLEADLEVQKQMARQSIAAPSSPGGRKPAIQPSSDADSSLNMPNLPRNYVSPEVVAKHRKQIAQLEAELKAERKQQRKADGEIIKLRAAVNGVELNEAEIDALLAEKQQAAPKKAEMRFFVVVFFALAFNLVIFAFVAQRQLSGPYPLKLVSMIEDAGFDADSDEAALMCKVPVEEEKEEPKGFVSAISDGIASAFGAGPPEREAPTRSVSTDFESMLPKIRRGFVEEEKEDAVVVGWNADVRSRKEREEVLRDDVHRFESQMGKYIHIMEEGVDVVMWQLNRAEDKDAPAEFPLKASHVTFKLHRKGDLLVQSMIEFILRGGYLSKAIGRNRGVNKTALEPLSLHDILTVKAGCAGYDHTELPSAAGRSKSKSKSRGENKQGSLFITLTATPTPMAASRSYILRFKSRSARNELLNGLRSILADMQINEGVNVSALHSETQPTDADGDDVMVPLKAVNSVMDREREAYDRILLMLLQGFEDLKDREDELVKLRTKLENVIEESAEKDRVQANDSKLIMQLSKKLETLLMDNEDLRDQNDRLNARLIAAECEKMNMMS
eukprot:scaffold10871_cov177-Cylindrotheca_fusiformis.AAC.5